MLDPSDRRRALFDEAKDLFGRESSVRRRVTFLFDEADALFGRRGEVDAAKDIWDIQECAMAKLDALFDRLRDAPSRPPADTTVENEDELRAAQTEALRERHEHGLE